MGTCQNRFRGAFFHEIVDFLKKSSLGLKKWFCLVASLVFEKHFHFRSDTSDYITTLNSSSMKTPIQLSRHDLPNKILMLNDDF